MPFFSIIIPLFNKRNFINNTLMSVIQQSFKDFELLIIDDFSTDGSDRIVTKFMSKYPDKNLKFIKNEKNKGVGFTRNVGLKQCSGEYILFLDADDEIFDKDLLSKAQNILKDSTINYLFLTRDYRGDFFKPKFAEIAKFVTRKDTFLFEIINKDKFSFYGNLPFGGSASAIISRNLALTERFNTDEIIFEDWDYFIKLFIKSHPYLLNFKSIKINYDESVNRIYRGNNPDIYDYLITIGKLMLTRKKIFWIWFNKHIRETHQLPNSWSKLIIKNVSLNYYLLKYQLRAAINWIKYIVIKNSR